MLKDDIIEVLNSVFERAKIPIKIKDLFLYRPVYHESPFEHFEPITEVSRLAFCDPVWMELEVEYDKHRYVYQLRCRNAKGRFKQKLCWLRMCDIFQGEDPKKLERDMKSNVNLVSRILLTLLELLSRSRL